MENQNQNKHKFWEGVLTGALVTVFAGLIVVGVSVGISMIGRSVIKSHGIESQAEGVTPEEEGLDLQRINEKASLIQQIIDAYFLFDEDLETVEEGIYSGLVAGLGDPYSEYFTEEEVEILMEDTEGIYCGIGAMISQNINTNIMTVVRVFEGTPAFEAGMQPGDIIYMVDGEDVTALSLDMLVNQYVKGLEGTKVTITVLRGSDYVELPMERSMIEVPTVEYEMLENSMGYVLITQFDVVTTEQFIAAVEDLESQGMEKLIIDLRGNPGGVLDTAVDMLAYLLPEDQLDGMLVYTEDKAGLGERYFCQDGKIISESDLGSGNSNYPKEDGHQLDLPIAVLVNENSASASELFTGALQDYGWATIVGTQTFGKGIVQSLFPLGDGSALKLTNSHYYTPSGKEIHQVGITPDVEIELDEEVRTKAVVTPEEDNQLQKAIEVLSEAE